MNTTPKQKGFTLIELLVVIAIIAVISAFAIPSYQDYIRRGYRVEARNALMEISQHLQKNITVYGNAFKYNVNPSDQYADGNAVLAKLGYNNGVPRSGVRRYRLAIDFDINQPLSYIITARAEGAQAKDLCTMFALNQSQVKQAASNPSNPSAVNKSNLKPSRDPLSQECWKR